jgi:biopolymer transport protein ExbD/biopolymer transport protein TolR
MGMSTGRSGGGPQSEINVTPMIDILLVLLIIFMVVQQEMQRGLSVQVPPEEPPTDAAPEQLVLSVKPGPEYSLNRRPMHAERLRQELASVFRTRERRVLMIQADERLPYSEVVHAVDASTAAGVQVIGLVPPEGSDFLPPGVPRM